MTPAIRTIIRSRWRPSKLGADLQAWWDADPTTWGNTGGITVTTGVSSWRDNVLGYDAIQTTDSLQPLYSASAFGYPCPTGDGVDDTLGIPAGLLALLPSAGAGEIWALLQQDALAADTTIRLAASYGGNTTTSHRSIARSVVTGVNRANIRVGDGGTQVATDTFVDLSSRHVVRGEFGAAASQISVDGNAPVSVAAVPATTLTRGRLFASNFTAASAFWQGPIAAVLFTRPLDAGKASALWAYLMSRRRV